MNLQYISDSEGKTTGDLFQLVNGISLKTNTKVLKMKKLMF